MNGFYRGKGPWWLGKKWAGKFFIYESRKGMNLFRVAGIYQENFNFRVEITEWNRIIIHYNYPFSFVKDELQEVSPGKYEGKIYFFGVKVGTFTLTKQD